MLPMIAATYFMVAGGPYGLEDIVQKTGYRATLLILLLTPLLWALPTAMMVSELATAIPEEGGFYVWVRRGMGRFMGYQETWLTMAGSVFEMALYPNLFVDYIGRFAPEVVAGHRGLAIGFAMIALCTAWNIVGVRAVGDGSVFLNVALLAPFVALIVIAIFHRNAGAAGEIPLRHADLLGGILIAMWNYMGWDNLSTIAGEVEAPQRTYSRAMLGSVILVIVSYLLPVAAVAHIGLDPNSWTTGGWVDVGRIVGGQALALGDSGGRSDWGNRIIRRADDVVHAATSGHGRGWLLAKSVCAAKFTHGRAVGRDRGLRAILGDVLPAGFRAEPYSRRAPHRAEHSPGILGARGVADSRAEAFAAVSSAGRDHWDYSNWAASAGADHCRACAQWPGVGWQHE